MTDEKKLKRKTVIEGITHSGEKFRPADWAERVCDSLSTFRGHRVIYSPLLQPAMRNGNRCVVMDDDLAKTHPALYHYVLTFATDNNLHLYCVDETD